MTRREPVEILSTLAHQGVKLELTTAHVCFLAALHLRAEAAAVPSFSDEELIDLYEQACDVVDPGAENPKKRAANAIQQLREQRFLTRVDGGGVARAGEYSLTKLATAVVGFFIEDDALTRESLTLLTATLRGYLANVLAAAKKAQRNEEWRAGVSAPLRITVSDLILGIDRRQRGLDAQQEEVQQEIARLLQVRWSDAIVQCQELLEATATTLRELNEILLRDRHQFVALLQDVHALAEAAQQSEVVSRVQSVIEHVDRLGSWGTARQRAWSEYYQRVHRYLQDVVRLDPDRAVSQRLRELISGWTEKPHFLVVAGAPSMVLLRAIEARVDKVPVKRAKEDREAAPALVASDDLRKRLEDRVRSLIRGGATDLVAITRSALELMRAEQRFAFTGEVAELVARIAATSAPHEREWKALVAGIEIEDWNVHGPRSES